MIEKALKYIQANIITSNEEDKIHKSPSKRSHNFIKQAQISQNSPNRYHKSKQNISTQQKQNICPAPRQSDQSIGRSDNSSAQSQAMSKEEWQQRQRKMVEQLKASIRNTNHKSQINYQDEYKQSQKQPRTQQFIFSKASQLSSIVEQSQQQNENSKIYGLNNQRKNNHSKMFNKSQLTRSCDLIKQIIRSVVLDEEGHKYQAYYQQGYLNSPSNTLSMIGNKDNTVSSLKQSQGPIQYIKNVLFSIRLGSQNNASKQQNISIQQIGQIAKSNLYDIQGKNNDQKLDALIQIKNYKSQISRSLNLQSTTSIPLHQYQPTLNRSYQNNILSEMKKSQNQSFKLIKQQKSFKSMKSISQQRLIRDSHKKDLSKTQNSKSTEQTSKSTQLIKCKAQNNKCTTQSNICKAQINNSKDKATNKTLNCCQEMIQPGQNSSIVQKKNQKSQYKRRVTLTTPQTLSQLQSKRELLEKQLQNSITFLTNPKLVKKYCISTLKVKQIRLAFSMDFKFMSYCDLDQNCQQSLKALIKGATKISMIPLKNCLVNVVKGMKTKNLINYQQLDQFKIQHQKMLENQCFSLLFKDRTYDFQCENQQVRDEYYKSLKSMIKGTQQIDLN